ncbi:MAG TPA: hypothetical protein VNZ53_57600, partial [Steroidobacteraceae bacterium]|nr:hypothetical protein [Steroidobacteraceae bacterium]
TSIASRPTFRDDAYAPLVEAGRTDSIRPGLEIPISLNSLTKLAFRRRRSRAIKGRASAMSRREWIKLSRPVARNQSATPAVLTGVAVQQFSPLRLRVLQESF